MTTGRVSVFGGNCGCVAVLRRDVLCAGVLFLLLVIS